MLKPVSQGKGLSMRLADGIRLLHPSLGAQVLGLDLSEPLDEARAQELRALWHQYHVLLFRDQSLDDVGQVKFSQHFGTLEVLPEPEQRAAKSPEIFRIANTDETGRIRATDDPVGVYLKIVEHWHTDSAYREVPSFGAILRALAVPPEGGQTQFVNLLDAYQALTPALQEQVAGRTISCSYEKTRAVPGGALSGAGDEAQSHMNSVHHPAVRRHPDRDGRLSLYISPVNMTGIDGLDANESERLLNDLLESVTQERFVYTHQWQAGDVLMWDNRCTMHRVLPYDGTQHARTMHRTALAGIEPVLPA
ncbi:MAG: alpha-ketoglutarate-dependent taurine dioxygenase [Gammaproteobacteria bacterium]|jgi:alpha-ketoglutarate-dependent taurine dioxygenase